MTNKPTHINILCCIDQEAINELLEAVISDYYGNSVSINLIACESDETTLEILKSNKIHYIFLLISNIFYKKLEYQSLNQHERGIQFIDMLIKNHSKNVILICNDYFYNEMLTRGYKHVLPLPFTIKELNEKLDIIEAEL